MDNKFCFVLSELSVISGISAALLIRLHAEYDPGKAVTDKGLQIKREILPAPKLAMA